MEEKRARGLSRPWTYALRAAVSGALVQFVPNRYDVSGPMRITGVTHRYGAEHLMSVTVRTDKQPRAAGSADTVTV